MRLFGTWRCTLLTRVGARTFRKNMLPSIDKIEIDIEMDMGIDMKIDMEMDIEKARCHALIFFRSITIAYLFC